MNNKEILIRIAMFAELALIDPSGHYLAMIKLTAEKAIKNINDDIKK